MSLPFTIDALGTRWWIEIFDDISDVKRAAIVNGGALLLSEFEQRYSRFRPDSLISQLNLTGVLINPPSEFINLLTYGITLFDRTQGKFNVMIGEKLSAHGYDSTYSFVGKAFKTPLPSPHNSLTITPEQITLHTGQVDIGGFGKGYVIDLLAEYLQNQHQLSYFLINGGGDMFATSENDQPIIIYLEHPTEPNTYIETTTIRNQGFAASSPHKRTWKTDGKVYSHIITESDSLLIADATFIKAPTARDADAFATVALIIPPDQFEAIASTERLGVATFTLAENTLYRDTNF